MVGMSHIQLLDCTLRDGGQGLETTYRAGISKVRFTDEILHQAISHLVKSCIDIVELGYIEKSQFAGHPFANYFTVEELSEFMPEQRNPRQMYVALYTGPDIEEDLIPEWNPKLPEGARVILRYSELEKSVDYCEMLTKKGYRVFVQPMLTMRYTDDELRMLAERANEMHAYALYFVDSFGYMQAGDVDRLFGFYDNRLEPDIRIGFHSHNNLNLAFSNVQHFLRIAGERKIIVDSTATGMGQGAGNLQTELILPYLNRNYGKKYNYDELLEVCEKIEPLAPAGQWGYSVRWALPAVYNTAYKYSMVMRMKMGFSYPKINYVMQHIPSDLRHRYTRENLEEVLASLELLPGERIWKEDGYESRPAGRRVWDSDI